MSLLLVKEADWSIAEKNVRQESNTRRVLGGRRAESRVASQMQKEQEKDILPCGRV